MSRSLRRYELLLPRRFNDEQPIPDELFGDTPMELRHRFGAASHETQIIRGVWEDKGQIYSDDLIRIFVDVADTLENRQFFENFKEELKTRFRQLEIWLTTYPIEAV